MYLMLMGMMLVFFVIRNVIYAMLMVLVRLARSQILGNLRKLAFYVLKILITSIPPISAPLATRNASFVTLMVLARLADVIDTPSAHSPALYADQIPTTPPQTTFALPVTPNALLAVPMEPV